LKSKIALCARRLGAGLLCTGLLAFGLTASGGALAQPVPAYYPGVVYPGYVPGLPPHEIVAIVRSTGLVPLSRPMRRGPIYALHAVDPAGQEVRVIVDARLGRILRVVPLLGPRYAMPVVPPPYGRPPGPIAMVPDGYGPNSRIAALPPGAGGPPVNGPGVAGVPGVPGHPPAVGAAPHPAPPAGPPLPRPRPKVAATDSSAPSGAATQASPLQASPSPGLPSLASPSQASPSQDAVKETKDTTGAVTPPAGPMPPPVEQSE
jgi:hypothetical protein